MHHCQLVQNYYLRGTVALLANLQRFIFVMWFTQRYVWIRKVLIVSLKLLLKHRNNILLQSLEEVMVLDRAYPLSSWVWRLLGINLFGLSRRLQLLLLLS